MALRALHGEDGFWTSDLFVTYQNTNLLIHTYVLETICQQKWTLFIPNLQNKIDHFLPTLCFEPVTFDTFLWLDARDYYSSLGIRHKPFFRKTIYVVCHRDRPNVKDDLSKLSIFTEFMFFPVLYEMLFSSSIPFDSILKPSHTMTRRQH